MEQNFKNMQLLDFNKSIEKAIKKYTLEVDDAIEAHGFKATSCIDYAEDTISELETTLKKHYLENNSSSLLFKNLEYSLNETANNIVNYTKEDALLRNNNFSNSEKIEERTDLLHSSLMNLNSRFYDSLRTL